MRHPRVLLGEAAGLLVPRFPIAMFRKFAVRAGRESFMGMKLADVFYQPQVGFPSP